MKRFLFVIFLVLTLSNCSVKTPFSKMDSYEQQMFREYEFHNIEALFKYVDTHELLNRSIVNVNGREYKVRVYRDSKRAEYDENLTIRFKFEKYQYIFYKKRNSLSMYSDNLSFSIIHKTNTKEYRFVSNRTSFGSQELKIYGYVYAYNDDNLIKLEDWVIRDAISRANSIRKPKK